MGQVIVHLYPNHNPLDIINWIRLKLTGTKDEDLPIIFPWYRDFTGSIKVIDRSKRKKRSKVQKGIDFSGSNGPTLQITSNGPTLQITSMLEVVPGGPVLEIVPKEDMVEIVTLKNDEATGLQMRVVEVVEDVVEEEEEEVKVNDENDDENYEWRGEGRSECGRDRCCR